MTTMTRVYSPPQHRLIMSLADRHDVPVAGRTHAEAELVERLFDLAGNHEIFDPESDKVVSLREASAIIDWLKELPAKQVAPQVTKSTELVGPGVYEPVEGQIFVVKLNRDKTRCYALRLVELPGRDRLTEASTHVAFDFEYDRGAIFNLHEDDRMTIERAKQLMIRYGRCLNCKRALKNGKSVEQGYGPVCIKLFRR